MTSEIDKFGLYTNDLLLEAAIKNPKPVSILLTGPSGSGKTFTIENVLNGISLKRQHISSIFVPATPEGWFALLGELMRDRINVLIIDHIEDMNMQSQAALFHAFSNTYGELSSFPDSGYDLKFIFTTLKPIEELRSSADLIMPHLYDRISHIIIRFHSLNNHPNIWGLFKDVWKGCHFTTNYELPKETSLRSWVMNNVEKMNGNFRDLEKLAIRWHHRRLLGYNEDAILPFIIKEYKEVGFGAEPESDSATFTIPIPNGSNVTWESIEADFRCFLRGWSLKEFGSVKIAASKLKISTRTLERWR